VIESFQTELARYRSIGQKALAQIPDGALDRVPTPDGNSVAVIVRHLSGNMKSRFTDFLTTDGEKPWRQRDREFEEWHPTRAELETAWNEGWAVLEGALAGLSDSHLQRQVTIRGQNLTVHDALSRALGHIAYHVGQIVLLARIHAEGGWDWISIPKGGSAAYNANPTKEKGPRA
jgi:Protein of unknown function (DUF1572)